MEREYKFRALTSNKDVEIKPVTLKALQFAIDKNSEVTNVAITGNYGAGKSSIVESFERECTDKKFIHISLGQYDEIKSSEKNGLDKREINTIEGKIINQLLHQINPNKIRKSIFKTLDAESQINPLNITLYLSLTILLSLYLFNISSWSELVHNFCWLSWTTKPIISLLVLIILFVLIVYGIYFLLKLQKDFGFIKKLSLKAEKFETDIEIFSNESSRVSYFDRYLDDVLYLFKQSEADVIVFEDIERFNDSRIFEKLKELNIIINRNRKANHKRKLVFFYLVKDDLFESQERTKFFDFIIPIVPVVTASNSHIKLNEILKEMGEDEYFDEVFLLNVALYLDDMRLINNICNEYLTYKETLDFEINPHKLFSLIVYKNIFPKDFSLLQRNQGDLLKKLNVREELLFYTNEETNIDPQDDIVTFFINNDYIDKNYRNYLSYFYGDGLLEDDKKFIKNVNSYIVNSRTIELTNFNEIVKRIALDNYKLKYVLNYSFFEFLLNPTSGGAYDRQLKYIFNQEDILNFITEFYKTLDRVDKLKVVIFKEDIIETFLKKWLEYNSLSFITCINNKKEYKVNSSIILSLLSLVDLEETDYKNNTVEDALSIYLQEHQELFCQNEYRNIDLVKKNLRWLKIRLKGFLSAKDSYNREIIDFIYNNQLYGIQKETLEFFTRFYLGDIINDSEFKHKNFEMIHEHSELYPIRDYCLSYRAEFLDYVWMYIKLSKNKMLDKPKYIEKLLNENIVFENKGMNLNFEPFKDSAAEKIIASIPKFYITYTEDKFNKLSNENRELLVKNLVQTKKAEVNTEIVLDYFSQNEEEDNLLVDFINQNGNFELDKRIYLKLDKELQEKFVYFVLEESNMNKNIRIRLVKEIGYPYYETFNEIDEDDNQMEHLIKYKLIDFNEDNLEFIRQKYPKHLASFIRINKFDYLNTAKDIRDEEQIRELLENLYLSEKYRAEILVFLLDNNFNKYDFDNLINQNRYDSLDVTLQNKIQKIVKKYIRQFITLDENEISIPLYESILNANDVLLEHKKELLEKLISDSESQIEVDKLTLLGDYLDLLELPDIMQILKEQIDYDIYTEWEVALDKLKQNEDNSGKGNQESKVSFSEFNEKLMDYLKKRKFISKKSRRENSVLRIFGLRSKQIDFKDSSGEINE
ncbi:hypothetical protein HRJ32_06790 [Streptococcus oralis subsp. oralis]|jgi:hypothetical protein|uniref:YobI family P-loop NTPase n=1 Tax=Streptococcus oralis TaxID=1303 RepID=UPI0015E612EC|nr:hypothetical protein [Streptococcus oralis]MBA1351767.1 hypothetical protein [Streptococcus oralis subsp. oralis]